MGALGGRDASLDIATQDMSRCNGMISWCVNKMSEMKDLLTKLLPDN